ncbi:BgTH12-03142 [Blumeria graminis f. sp. triticale]|uniref:Bgt-50289 n=2 Tax=Blumeria graminis TaxID=34373 RepID=A0A9X9LBV3_BLUGR|nr:BgTH12-03142 [Blumeria graminis f. sp. triticale]VCU41272.1 Bgt-50289 [Blumeria graminis f. sp. tritici]
MKINSRAFIIYLMSHIKVIDALNSYLCRDGFTITPQMISDALRRDWDSKYTRPYFEHGREHRYFLIEHCEGGCNFKQPVFYAVAADRNRRIIRVFMKSYKYHNDCTEIS